MFKMTNLKIVNNNKINREIFEFLKQPKYKLTTFLIGF